MFLYENGVCEYQDLGKRVGCWGMIEDQDRATALEPLKSPLGKGIKQMKHHRLFFGIFKIFS
jgi:hypothetical protein